MTFIHLKKALLWTVGAISLFLGIIGIFVPVLPTVPFVLLTSICWLNSSPKFHKWLSSQRYFGEIIRNWEQNRAVSYKAKRTAWIMMAVSCGLLFLLFPERWYVGAFVSVICLCTGFWLARFPD